MFWVVLVFAVVMFRIHAENRESDSCTRTIVSTLLASHLPETAQS